MSAKLLFGVTLGNRATTIISQLAVGTFLTPTTVGLWALALNWSLMISLFQSGHLARIPLQAHDDYTHIDAGVFNWLFVGCALTALSSLIAAAFIPEGAGGALVALTSLSFFRLLTNRRVTWLSRQGATSQLAWMNAAEGLSRAAVLVCAAALGAGVWSFVFGELAAVMALYLAAGYRQNVTFAWFRRTDWWLPVKIRTKMAATLGICALEAVEMGAVPALIAVTISIESAGAYFFANRIAGQITVLILPLILYEALPALLQARTQRPTFLAKRIFYLRRFGLIAGILGSGAALVGPFALDLIWGEKWQEAAQMLHILGVTVALRLMYMFTKAQLEALGRLSDNLILGAIDITAILTLLVMAATMQVSALSAIGMLAVETVILTAASHQWAKTQALRLPQAVPAVE